LSSCRAVACLHAGALCFGCLSSLRFSLFSGSWCYRAQKRKKRNEETMAMNAFRVTGDLVHLIAIVILLHRIFIVKNAQGLSRKTQELYLVVFVARYLDLFTSFYSVYNSLMKMIYIGWTGALVTALKIKSTVQETYRSEQDGFPHWKKLVSPCVCIAFLVHFIGSGFAYFDLLELFWTFSILLEAVSTLPQILMYRKYREVESLTGGSFILLMGGYRFMYILNWIYRAHTEKHYKHHWLVYYCGVVQAIVGFAGFFWPPENVSSSAPLLPQLQRALESMRNLESAKFFGFIAVGPILLLALNDGQMMAYGVSSDILVFSLFVWFIAAMAVAVIRLLAMRQSTASQTNTDFTNMRDCVLVNRPTGTAKPEPPIEASDALTEPLLQQTTDALKEDSTSVSEASQEPPNILVV
jgi:ER lumen protein retaining receptor